MIAWLLSTTITVITDLLFSKSEKGKNESRAEAGGSALAPQSGTVQATRWVISRATSAPLGLAQLLICCTDSLSFASRKFLN